MSELFSGFWMLMVFLKMASLYMANSLSMGVMMLGLSFMISILSGLYFIPWVSLIFFIMYMGGLLVLFFYVSSLNYNPAFMFFKKEVVSKPIFVTFLKCKLMFMLYSCLMVSRSEGNMHFFAGSEFKKFSLCLFKEYEFLIMVSIGVVLLLVLWMVKKLTFKNRGALRPMFGDKKD